MIPIRLLVTLVCVVTSLRSANGAPKTVSDHKINFGWPNFFNPEMGMIRDKADKKNKEKKYEGVGEGNDNTQETETQKSSHEDVNEHEELQDDEYLIDYTVKGGLRGTLVLGNSSMEGLDANLTEVLTNLLQEGDPAEGSEQLTEDGTRLGTPLVTKKHTAALGKYGALITYYADSVNASTKFIYYGNWCGRGGRSAPLDNLDKCCLEHQKCYGRLIKQCPDVWKRPYDHMYAWTILDHQPVCLRAEAFCVNHVCECDRQAAMCFQYYLSSPAQIPTHVGVQDESLVAARNKQMMKVEEQVEEQVQGLVEEQVQGLVEEQVEEQVQGLVEEQVEEQVQGLVEEQVEQIVEEL